MLQNKYVSLAMMGAVVLLTVIMLTIIPAKIKRDVTKEVIQQLQRDYVPGPYAPGYDPDKVPVQIKK